MNKLPNEILHNIFIQVPFKSRLESMLVCHYWCNYLRKRSLLFDVEIRNDDMFNKFIAMLQRLPSHASHVEMLTLEISRIVDKRILCNVLVSLRVFNFSRILFTGPGQNHCSKPFELEHPNSKLEIIKDEGECELTRQLLMFGSCMFLRKLDVKLNIIDNPRKELLVYLKSAPNLKDLTLRYCDIGIEDIEVIHNNVPNLERLELFRVIMVAGVLPDNITPAPAMKNFVMQINRVKNYPQYPHWYIYLANKYINIATFEYSDPEINSRSPDHWIKIYREGIFPIFKRMGTPLPQFDVNKIPDEVNPFNILDEFGIRAPKFSLRNSGNRPIFEQLAESNQSKYAETISLLNSAITTPVLLQNFTSLKSIDIYTSMYFPKWNVNLTDYFNAVPPTLTTFRAVFGDVEFNELPSYPNHIQHLNIECSTLTSMLGEVISNFFPDLNSLILKGRINENININLPDHHFKRIDIRIDYKKTPSHGFSITNASSSQPQYYIERDTPKNITYTTAEELQDKSIVSISYATSVLLRCDNLSINSRKK